MNETEFIKWLRDRKYQYPPNDPKTQSELGGFLIPTTAWMDSPGIMARFWRWLGSVLHSPRLYNRGRYEYPFAERLMEALHNK